MRCVICNGNEIEVKTVHEEISNGNDVVHVPVTIPVCRNCGEKYYDRLTMIRLEKTDQNLISNRVGLKEIGKVLLYEENAIN